MQAELFNQRSKLLPAPRIDGGAEIVDAKQKKSCHCFLRGGARQELSAPVPEIKERADGPERSREGDSGDTEPAHENQIEHNIETEIEDAAVKNQIGAAHGDDIAVIDAADDEKRNLYRVHGKY